MRLIYLSITCVIIIVVIYTPTNKKCFLVLINYNSLFMWFILSKNLNLCSLPVIRYASIFFIFVRKRITPDHIHVREKAFLIFPFWMSLFTIMAYKSIRIDEYRCEIQENNLLSPKHSRVMYFLRFFSEHRLYVHMDELYI